MDMENLGFKVAEILLPLLLAALTWASTKLAAFIRAKVKNEYLAGVLIRLDDAVLAAVKEAEQVAVKGLKLANTDGKVTDDEKARIKRDVVACVRSHLGMKGLAELAQVLGLDDLGVNRLLASKIEAAVYDVGKTEQPANPTGLVPG